MKVSHAYKNFKAPKTRYPESNFHDTKACSSSEGSSDLVSAEELTEVQNVFSPILPCQHFQTVLYSNQYTASGSFAQAKLFSRSRTEQKIKKRGADPKASIRGFVVML